MSRSKEPLDAVVVGVGGIGSAALYHLAARGLDVVGFDKYNIPNAIGSSHGDSRLIRLTNYENPAYVPLVQRALELWTKLETEAGTKLFHQIGTLDAGPPNSPAITGAIESCTTYDLPYEHLTATELTERFPAFALPNDYEAVYQPDGGYINPTQAVQAHVELAQRHGARANAHEPVTNWEETDEHITVHTDRDTYRTRNLVITAGAWTHLVANDLSDFLTPWRVIVGGFQPQDPTMYRPDKLPVFSIETNTDAFYGGPITGTSGFKFGLVDYLEDTATPNEFDPQPTKKERDRLHTTLRENASRFFPTGIESVKRLKTCMVTHTPDHDFIIDSLPEHPNVIVGAGFSGRGFKFASVMGELLAKEVTGEPDDYKEDLFRLDRFERPRSG